MFLLYLDDSGSANNAHEEYLVLGGLCVSEHQINDLTHAVDLIASRINPADPDRVEFHASEIFSGRVDPWKAIKDKAERQTILQDVLGVVAAAAHPACVVACAVHKRSFAGRDPMEIAFEELCLWFDTFLRVRHRESGEDQKGMIFLDESTCETSLRRFARDFRRRGAVANQSRYVTDVPHFVQSHTTRCVQLADHRAYSVFRYYHAKDMNYLFTVLNRFQSDGRVLQGLRHLRSDKDKCICPACLTERSLAGHLGQS
jgi:hypothetical protein